MKRLFGTNGVRGVVNDDLTPEFAYDIAGAIARYAEELNIRSVALGTDTRDTGDMIVSATASAFMEHGLDVDYLGASPTPAIQLYVKKNEGMGVVITASHNPPQFNGIKCIAPDGTELPREEEEKIEGFYFSGDFAVKDTVKYGRFRHRDANREYIKAVVDTVDAESIKKKNFRVVLDCSNGASVYTSPYILREFSTGLTTLNAQPDGHFSGHESEPLPENLTHLIQAVKDSDAELGIAHDGDADRVVFVDEKGNYITGDRSLAIIAAYLIEKNGGGVAVTTVSTSLMVEEMVKRAGGKVIYTKVGAPVVARKMIESGAIVGGEENGGIIISGHQVCRDGAMAMATLLEILAKTGRSLSELVAELPEYHQVKLKVHCPEEIKEKVMDELRTMEDADTTDGVKFNGEDWWVLIRPSGTEPIYRVYAESKSRDEAEALGEKYRRILESVIKEKLNTKQ